MIVDEEMMSMVYHKEGFGKEVEAGDTDPERRE